MPNKPTADGLSASETPQGERLKEQLRSYAGRAENPIHAATLNAALLRIEHLEADLAAERDEALRLKADLSPRWKSHEGQLECIRCNRPFLGTKRKATKR